jgi:hypothetical protein
LIGAGLDLLQQFTVDPGDRDYFGDAVPKFSIGADSAGAKTLAISTAFPSPITAGTAGTLTVTLKNYYGHVATDYRGTVHFSSTDPQAVLPADYTFTAADAGVHTFHLTLKTAGSRSITITDLGDPVLTAKQTGITVNPAAASRLVVSGFPTSTSAGVANNFTVTAKDPYGNVATGYTGTVHFSSSDHQAVLPGEYTFISGDNGTHTFSATLNTPGTQSLTATDTVTATITGTESGIVVAGTGPNSSGGNGDPSAVVLGTAGTSAPVVDPALPVTDPTSLPAVDPSSDQGSLVSTSTVDPAAGDLTQTTSPDGTDPLDPNAPLV